MDLSDAEHFASARPFARLSPVTDRILLIEDDARLAEMVRDYLGEAGFRVARAASGNSGLAMHAREAVDAIVLDLMLPDMDGLEVCRQIRARAATPILMLTARGDAMDRVIGLEMGADDYLPKPFEPRELLARLKAILRRGAAPARKDDVLRFAAGLEKGAVSAYLGAVPILGSGELARAAASILGDEAMHWAVLRYVLGENPVPHAFVS